MGFWKNIDIRGLASLGPILLDMIPVFKALSRANRYVKQYKYKEALEACHQASHLADQFVIRMTKRFNATEDEVKELEKINALKAWMLCHIANLYRILGNYVEAAKLMRQALDIFDAAIAYDETNDGANKRNSGDLYREKSWTIRALALLYKDMGDYDNAISLLEKGIEYMQRYIKDHEYIFRPVEKIINVNLIEYLIDTNIEIADMRFHLGCIYFLMENVKKVEELMPLAIAAYCTHKKESLEYCTGLLITAILQTGKLNITQAQSSLEEAILILNKIGKTENPITVGVLQMLAELYRIQGEYDKAKAFYLLVVEIARKVLGGSPQWAAEVLFSVATLAFSEAILGGATNRSEQVVPPEFKALIMMKEATNIEDDTVGQFFSIGSDDQRMTYSKSLQQHSFQFLSLISQLLNYSELLKVPNYSELLKALIAMTGSELYLRHATLQERANWLTLQMPQKAVAAEALATQGTQRDAVLAAEFAVRLLKVIIATMGLELVLRRKAIAAEALATQRDAVLAGRYPSLAQELQKLTVLRTQIAQMSLHNPSSEDYTTHLKILKDRKAEKARLEAELASQIPEMDIEQKLRKVDREAVASMLPKGSILVEFVRVDIFDFQARLALFELPWKSPHYLAFTVPADGPVHLFDLGDADVIDQKIVTFRQTITGERAVSAEEKHAGILPSYTSNHPSLPMGTKEAYQRHASPEAHQYDEERLLHEGMALRTLVFDPLFQELEGHQHLFLSPDGDLARLPFEVLPTIGGRYLIDDYHISYLSVGRDVLRFASTPPTQPTPPLVVADPDFNLGGNETETPETPPAVAPTRQSGDLKTRNIHFDRLPGTRVEGELVAAELGITPLLEQAALKSSIKTCQSPYILHIATHGFFLPNQKREDDLYQLPIESLGGITRLSHLENPLLRSGLALAGANTWLKGSSPPPEAEEGLLTAEDVSGLNLLDTELVVLSACETGLGEVQIGEGVFGLRRSFQLAGAKRLVMSLWKVPDQQTQELMVDFYRLILQGQPCAEALRKAQLAIKSKYPHPYNWGAFICQGDAGPLKKQ